MDLVIYTLRSMAYAIVEPLHLVMLVVFGILFYLKNRKLVSIQKMTLGEGLNTPLRTYIITNCIRNISRCNWEV